MMFEIKYWPNRNMNKELLHVLAHMDGWTGSMVNRTLFLNLYGERIFDISKKDSASFCSLVAEHEPGSPLYNTILEAVSEFIQPFFGNEINERDMKMNRDIVLAACGGDKEKAAAMMVRRELNK